MRHILTSRIRSYNSHWKTWRVQKKRLAGDKQASLKNAEAIQFLGDKVSKRLCQSVLGQKRNPEIEEQVVIH